MLQCRCWRGWRGAVCLLSRPCLSQPSALVTVQSQRSTNYPPALLLVCLFLKLWNRGDPQTPASSSGKDGKTPATLQRGKWRTWISPSPPCWESFMLFMAQSLGFQLPNLPVLLFEFCWELEVPFTLQRSFCCAWVTSGPAGSPALTGLRSLVPPSSSSSQHILALFLSSCWGCPVPDGFSPACTQLPRGKKSPNSFPCWAGLRTQPQEQHLRGYGWSLPWAPGAGR